LHFRKQQQWRSYSLFPTLHTPTGIFLQAVHVQGCHNICYESTICVTGFIYGDPYFVFPDIISCFVDCILVAISNIFLSQRGIGGNGMSCAFFQELSKTGGLYFM
jgi:hypothetical protein